MVEKFERVEGVPVWCGPSEQVYKFVGSCMVMVGVCQSQDQGGPCMVRARGRGLWGEGDPMWPVTEQWYLR